METGGTNDEDDPPPLPHGSPRGTILDQEAPSQRSETAMDLPDAHLEPPSTSISSAAPEENPVPDPQRKAAAAAAKKKKTEEEDDDGSPRLTGNV